MIVRERKNILAESNGNDVIKVNDKREDIILYTTAINYVRNSLLNTNKYN